jgi:hypothetical protein
MIIKATWRDLGYRSIGPEDPTNADQRLVAKMLGEVLEKHAGYEVKHEQDAVWIRDPARAKGKKRQPAAEIRAVIDAANRFDESQLGFIREVQGTIYRDFQMPTNLGGKSLSELLAEFIADPRASKGTYSLAMAFAKCPLTELSDFLRRQFFPAFWGAYPNGRIVLVKHNPLFETRFSTVRAGYTLQQYGRIDNLNLQSFETMSHWQILSPSIQLRMILDLGAVAFLPTIQYFTAGRTGITMVMIPDQQVELESLDFPTSWAEVYRSHWDFGREERITTAAGFSTVGVSANYRALRRYIQAPTFGVEDVKNWVSWLVDRFNVLQFHQTDPAEFEDQGRVDFVTCLEHALSVDRVLRKGIGAAVSVETIVCKSAAMEIADLLEELSNYWKATTGSQRSEFKTLFHSIDGLALLKRAYAGMPRAIADNLIRAASAVYAHLQSAIVESVFVSNKKSAAGDILVRDRALANEVPEAPADFVANIIRCLRNTHHGYLTKRDSRGLRPSRYLALISGNLPNTFQYLGTLFAIALLADPQVAAGWSFMPVSSFD